MFGSAERGRELRQLAAICGALLTLTLAVYWPTLSHDFVNYDDPEYITSNTSVTSGLTGSNVVWAITTGYASNWHPLTWISHMVDCQFYGLKPGGHHLTNLLFHTANVLLLFTVLLVMTKARWASAFVAALFAWHPLHVESVAWISERKDVLSTFFWLLTMLAYARYVKESKVQGLKFKVFYGLALVCFLLGLLSKPMVVTLPFVLLLLDYWPLGRSAERGVRSAEFRMGRRVTWRWFILEKVPFFFLALGSSVVTFIVQQKGGAVSSLNSLPIGARITNALVSYLRYAGKIFWPQNLSVLYPHPGSWSLGLVTGAVIFLAGTSVMVWRARQTQPWLAVGWLWFLGTLVPVIGLVQVGMQSMADRYTYIPAIGLFIMLAWGVPESLTHWPRRALVLSAASGMLLAACLVITSPQVRYWKNGETLFRHAVKVTRNNYLAYNNLGYYLENHGNIDEALPCYEKAVEINPNYEEARNNLGHLLSEKGKYDAAIVQLEAALRIKPSLVEAQNNLGNALSSLGKVDEGIAHYLLALKYQPADVDARNNLGIARAMQGRLDEAAQLLTEAVRLKPTDAGAHGNLGNVLAAQHKLDKAIKQYQIALQLNPTDAQAFNNLGNIWSEEGRLDEARESYEAALKLKPENPEANYNLGIVLLRQGKAQEAARHFAEAVRLKPDYAEAQRQLDALVKQISNR